MSAERCLPEDDVFTGDALLRWAETAELPEGIDLASWERWVQDGCSGQLEEGVPVTRAMLGHWARTGVLR